MQRNANLMQIASAPDTISLLLGPAERWQKHRRQNRDDCDHYKQFDQGETGAAAGL
jgi:hypothetical protein